MNNILVTGSDGQLGSELRETSQYYLDYNFLFTDLSDLDITNHTNVNDFVQINNIKIIINCAAYTAPDKAESEPELAKKINHLAVANLSKIAKHNNIKMIHLSTDYVFEGINIKPYLENDKTNPRSVYGQTKLDGELAMKKINPKNSIIIRTSWLYSSYGNNFVKTMLELAETMDEISVVSDQIGSPTNAADLALIILEILPQLENTSVELFHFSNLGNCSWYDYAKAIFDIAEVNVKLNPVKSSQYPTAAKRPSYSVLSKSKIINRYNIEILFWRQSLKREIQKIKQKNLKFN